MTTASSDEATPVFGDDPAAAEGGRRHREALARAAGPAVMAAFGDPDVTEIYVNPGGRLFLDTRAGRRASGEVLAASQVLRFLNLVASAQDAVLDAARPQLQAELQAVTFLGARLQGFVPPLVAAPAFNLRKPPARIYSLDEYVAAGSLAPRHRDALAAALAARRDVLVAGGTGSGKTTLCNALLREIARQSPHERIVILEDTVELRSAAADTLALRTTDALKLKDLVKAALRTSPDRIVVGEVRDEAALDLLDAWQTGHPGGCATVHADHPLAAAFEAEADQLERRLSTHLKVARLGVDDLLTHLHACLTGLDHPVRAPRHGAYLDGLLADQPITGGWTPRVGALALRAVAVHGFPHESFSGILDFLGGLGFPFRASHRIIPLSQASAARHIARIRLGWFKKRRGAAAWLRELTAGSASAPSAARERDDELFLDQDAGAMARDAADAAGENAAGRVRFCLYTPVVLVADRDPARADHNAAEVVKALNDRGFTARVEDVNALEALRGSLPGHGWANLRRPLVSTRNLADLLPVTSVWPGLPHNPSPLFPRRSPALLWAATTGATPFWLNLHDDDVGHTLVVGGTGAGKSTLLNLLIAQFLRYPHAQAFSFDIGYSGWLLARAAGARHYDLVNEPVALQPLAAIDRRGERLWALEWLTGVLAQNGVAVTPQARQALAAALDLLATEPRRHRRLSELLPQLQERQLAAALAPYAEGSLAHLLDAGRDDLEAGGPYQVFELERLVDMDDRVLLPVLLYLFHRVEQRLEQGRPSLLVVEEAWLPLMKSAFAARIKQWLLTLRKQSAAVVLATQSLSQLWESPSRHVLLESCPTRILLANPEAATPGHRGLYLDLGLNDTEIHLIAHARRKRDYYFKSPRGSRLFELGLGPAALAFVGTPEGMTLPETIAQARQLIAAHGDAWPRAWLDRRGLASYLPLYDQLAAAATAAAHHPVDLDPAEGGVP